MKNLLLVLISLTFLFSNCSSQKDSTITLSDKIKYAKKFEPSKRSEVIAALKAEYPELLVENNRIDYSDVKTDYEKNIYLKKNKLKINLKCLTDDCVDNAKFKELIAKLKAIK